MHIPLKRVQMPNIMAVKRIPEARKRKIKKNLVQFCGESGMIEEKGGLRQQSHSFLQFSRKNCI